MAGTPRRVRRAVIAFTPRATTLRWIDNELAGEPFKVIGVGSMAELIERLRERSNLIAIVDFDATTDEDIAALEALRKSRWTGELIALGHVDPEVRTALRVRDAFMRPLGSERLRKSISEITVDNLTLELPALVVPPPTR